MYLYKNNTYEYRIIREERTTVSMSVKPDLTLELKAPVKMTEDEIEDFILRHSRWIDRRLERMKAEQGRRLLMGAEIEELCNRAMEYIPKRAAYFSEQMGVNYAGITVTGAKTRWGSCSSKKRICFSYRVMLLDAELVDYVIVHELAHLKEMNHSERFYKLIENILPDYKERIEKIKTVEGSLPK